MQLELINNAARSAFVKSVLVNAALGAEGGGVPEDARAGGSNAIKGLVGGADGRCACHLASHIRAVHKQGPYAMPEQEDEEP